MQDEQSAVKLMPCKICGCQVVVSLYRGKPVRCKQCAIQAQIDQITQMAQKSGPYYERWLSTAGPTGRSKGRGTPPVKGLLITTGQ